MQTKKDGRKLLPHRCCCIHLNGDLSRTFQPMNPEATGHAYQSQRILGSGAEDAFPNHNSNFYYKNPTLYYTGT